MRESLARSKVYCVERSLDTCVEITRFAADFIARRSHCPTFLFRQPKGFPGFPVLLNWLTRTAILDSLGVDRDSYDRVLASRLHEPSFVAREAAPLFTRELAGLDALPVLQHQPRDLGRYLTSFVGVLRDPANGNHNTGFYRVYVKSSREGVIFMDPRTHAHALLQPAHGRGEDVPITLFAGAELAHCVAAASTVPRAVDSFDAACRLAGADLLLARSAHYPPAPAAAEVVIHARVLARREVEAPFGEFKGYYCPATRSPVLAIDHVWTRPDAMYPALFCGKESGLTLMSLTNEICMHQRLVEHGFRVQRVRYPLSALGEFLTIVETDEPSDDLLECALSLDHRTKLVLVTETNRADRSLLDLGAFDFAAHTLPYVKRGEAHGERLGAVLRRNASERSGTNKVEL